MASSEIEIANVLPKIIDGVWTLQDIENMEKIIDLMVTIWIGP